MTESGKVILRVIITIIATIVALPLGAYASAAFCDHFVLPGWIQKYPHDGQLGLGVMMYAIFGGLGTGLAVFVAGLIWTIRGSKRKQDSELTDTASS